MRCSPRGRPERWRCFVDVGLCRGTVVDVRGRDAPVIAELRRDEWFEAGSEPWPLPTEAGRELLMWAAERDDGAAVHQYWLACGHAVIDDVAVSGDVHVAQVYRRGHEPRHLWVRTCSPDRLFSGFAGYRAAVRQAFDAQYPKDAWRSLVLFEPRMIDSHWAITPDVVPPVRPPSIYVDAREEVRGGFGTVPPRLDVRRQPDGEVLASLSGSDSIEAQCDLRFPQWAHLPIVIVDKDGNETRTIPARTPPPHA